jgi:hypothetical protein
MYYIKSEVVRRAIEARVLRALRGLSEAARRSAPVSLECSHSIDQEKLPGSIRGNREIPI